MLHILMRSPFTCHFQDFLRIIGKRDELLLLSDGVIAGMSDSVIFKDLVVTAVPIYALESDVVTYCLSNYISESVNIIDYIGFVKLTEKHLLSFSW